MEAEKREDGDGDERQDAPVECGEVWPGHVEWACLKTADIGEGHVHGEPDAQVEDDADDGGGDAGKGL